MENNTESNNANKVTQVFDDLIAENNSLKKEVQKYPHYSPFSSQVSLGDLFGILSSAILVIFLFGKLNQTVKRLEDDMRRNFDYDKSDGSRQDDRIGKLETEVARLSEKIECIKQNCCKKID